MGPMPDAGLHRFSAHRSSPACPQPLIPRTISPVQTRDFICFSNAGAILVVAYRCGKGFKEGGGGEEGEAG